MKEAQLSMTGALAHQKTPAYSRRSRIRLASHMEGLDEVT